MTRAIPFILAGLALTSAAFSQSAGFERKPPGWQVALAATPSPAAGKSIAAKGKGAATACAGCHGAKGVPPAGTPFPRLAGLPAEYVAKQLFDYRDGTRPHPLMGPIAKALADAEIASLARHYATFPAPALRPAPSSSRGSRLARSGDNALAIPACADCHGSDRDGGGPILPPLAQPGAYTTAQFQAFRSGERRNDGEGVMRGIAKRLSEDDIRALADYYAKR